MGVGGGLEKAEGIKQPPSKAINQTHRQRPQYEDYQRGRGVREVGEGKRGMNCDGGRSDWGGEHTPQYTDGVLWNCTPETYIVLLTNVAPINSIERKKR